MIRNITVGIDVGTHATRVVVSEWQKGERSPHIIGTGQAVSRGLRHGYIVDVFAAAESIKQAAREAEKNANIKIRRAYISAGGISLHSEIALGSAIISKADSEVTTLDITKAIGESEENLKLINKKVVYSIPLGYKLDGKEIFGKAEGMHGVKLEVKTLFVTCLEQHLDDLVTAVTEAGIEVLDIIASPLASGDIVLSERQKTAGCLLVDIGSETVSACIFENGNPIAFHVFSIGGSDITNDIALGLRIPLEEAEGIKIGSIMNLHPKKKLEEIIEARLSDIFELIDKFLKKNGRSALLPAGVVLIGGSAHLPGIDDLSRVLLRLPSKVGTATNYQQVKSRVKDTAWYVALGLGTLEKGGYSQGQDEDTFGRFFKSIGSFFKSIGKQLLP